MLGHQLAEFLHTARLQGYLAVRQVPVYRESDGSSTLRYGSGQWRYHDNYFGGNPFAGREIVHHDNRPVWAMVYYGAVVRNADAGLVFGWLRHALQSTPVGGPRGPAACEGDGWSYTCHSEGDLGGFTGTEQITCGGGEVYRGWFAGGWVDRAEAV